MKHPERKLCNGCSQLLPISDFGTYKKGQRPRSRCKKCESDFSRIWRKDNPGLVKAKKKAWQTNNRDKYLRYVRRRNWKSLGLDPDVIEDLLSNHDGKCEICGLHFSEVGSLRPDHDHTTGLLRGFLCNRCNLGLGQLGDRVDVLKSAIAYLEIARDRAKTMEVRRA